MLQNYWKFQNRNVQTFGFVYHDTNGPNPVWKTQSFPLSEICMVILWQDCHGKGNLRKSYWNTVGRRFLIWNDYSYTVKKGCSYLCMWMTSDWLERDKINPMWKVLNKEVDLGEPTSFHDHVYLGCTQRQCEISKDIVDNYRTMFESRISRSGTEQLPYSENLRISSWSYHMEGHAKKCVERYRELANKTTQQLYKVSTPCIDDHHFKEEELKSVGELSKVSSQIVLKCLYLARIGRPDILWSVNKLARSITKWTKACDKRLNRLISYIHHTCEYKQFCYVGNTANNAGWGLFQDSDFAADLQDSKSTSGGTLCVFGSHTFVTISWMCKKQTSVSHSSTESEIISLDAGLRLDGLLALELWDLIVSVFGNTTQEALLCVFEDNEAVIKMIIKGRSPTMRHVSRTHRVALDWLSERINLDSKIQIKYIDTKKPTRRHIDKGKFHTWRVESSSVFVSHWPFQFHRLFWSNVEKNAKRFRWRKSHKQNRSRWWIWSRDAAKGLRTCCLLLHQLSVAQPMTRTRVAQVVSLACAHHIPWVISMRLLHFPLFAVYLLSYHPVFLPGHQLYLPRCGGQIPCALQLMRTLAPLPSSTLSHSHQRLHNPISRLARRTRSERRLVKEVLVCIMWRGTELTSLCVFQRPKIVLIFRSLYLCGGHACFLHMMWYSVWILGDSSVRAASTLVACSSSDWACGRTCPVFPQHKRRSQFLHDIHASKDMQMIEWGFVKAFWYCFKEIQWFLW